MLYLIVASVGLFGGGIILCGGLVLGVIGAFHLSPALGLFVLGAEIAICRYLYLLIDGAEG